MRIVALVFSLFVLGSSVPAAVSAQATGPVKIGFISPLSGVLVEVNQKVVDEPETVNADTYGEGWLVRIRLSNPAEVEGLMDAAGYESFVAQQ